jgi:HK97 family phage prohead protease
VHVKDFAISVKVGPGDDLGEGVFTAYASVFGVKDSYGDMVVKGAFTDTLADWETRDAALPLLFAHNMADPDYNIGHVVEAVEDDHGLRVTGQLDLDNPKAVQVYRLLKGRRIDQMSFAFDVVAEHVTGTGDDKTRELTAVKLYEVSVVTLGANQETSILEVRARRLVEEVKEGRVLAQKHIDSLRSAQDAIGVVIKAAEANLNPSKASEPSGCDVKTEAPPRGNAKDSAAVDLSVSAWETHIGLLREEN